MDFEKLDVWKRSKALSINLYKELWRLKDWSFKDQITRSGLSIPSNIAEGMVRISNVERIRFLNIAQGSCAELVTQIYIGKDIGYLKSEFANTALNEAKEIRMMLQGLIVTIKRTN